VDPGHRDEPGEEADEHRDRVEEHELLVLTARREDGQTGHDEEDPDAPDGGMVPVRPSEPLGQDALVAIAAGKGLEQARARLER